MSGLDPLVFGDNNYLELAALSAAHAEHGVPHRYASVCCGLAGRSYALLDLYSNTNDSSWLRRAEQMANAALEDNTIDHRPWSLFKGRLGVALLIEELKAPDQAGVPLYGYRPKPHERNRASERFTNYKNKEIYRGSHKNI